MLILKTSFCEQTLRKVDFFVVVDFFLERPPTHVTRLAFDSTASAVEFYIILHKILTETVYYNHN